MNSVGINDIVFLLIGELVLENLLRYSLVLGQMELGTLTVPEIYFLSRQIMITYYVQELQALLIPIAQYFKRTEAPSTKS